MSKKTLKKLEDQLNCSICLDTYTKPKLLQCFHVYCSQCLERIIDRDREGHHVLVCPICRQGTPVPERGVAGLQAAFHVGTLFEIRDDLREAADSDDVAKNSTKPVWGATHEEASPQHCSEHVQKGVELFCNSCEELICVNCVTRGGRHRSHDHEPIGVAFGKYRQDVQPLLIALDKNLSTGELALEQLAASRGNVISQKMKINAKIRSKITKLHKVLELREAALIGRLEHMTQEKLGVLTAQQDQIETTQAQLASCHHFIKESLASNHPAEVLQMQRSIVTRAEALSLSFVEQTTTLKPRVEADMAFLAFPNAITTCQDFGHVFTSFSPDPSKCYIPGEQLVPVTTAETMKVRMQAVNYMGETCDREIESLSCEIVSSISGSRMRCASERKGQSQYEISYQPTIKGKHQLYIKIDGQEITGSPYNVVVRLCPQERLGTTEILTIGNINRPWDVALGPNGEIIVTSLWEHQVSIFSSCGKLIRCFGAYGEGEGFFRYPQGVTTDRQGNIVVVDSGNHRIQKFSSNGAFLGAISVSTKCCPPICRPQGIAFNATNGRAYVAHLNRVEMFNSNLTPAGTFGAKGRSSGQLQNPIGIACDTRGRVYVADSGNNRIQVFSADGKFLKMFSKCGERERGLNRPSCVTVDTNSVVYVSEGYNNRVCLFSPKGDFLEEFGSEGEGPGHFVGPTGLVVDSSGVVYVCDQVNNTVKVF